MSKSFNEIFESVYKNPTEYKNAIFNEMASIEKSASMGLGHPKFQDLEIGETIPGSLIVFFMDIRGFTKMSIALDNSELVKILQAITAASIISIRQYGGYVIDFTGDGVMAYFGEGLTTTESDAFNALRASALLMQGIKETINKYLNKSIDETVRVGMGIEYGNVLWTKIGMPDTNEVKPISEVSFIAGKNSSQSDPWEVLMGKNIAAWLPDQLKEEYKPYTFQKDNKQYSYERFLFNWMVFYRQFCEGADNIQKLLLRNRLPELKPIIKSSDGTITNQHTVSNSTGPRPLKDQPFFNR